MTLKCFKQNRVVDGGVLLRQLRDAAEATPGKGVLSPAAAGGLGLGLGTGKTKSDQHLAAPGMAETESAEEQLHCWGKRAEARHKAAKTPGEQVGS